MSKISAELKRLAKEVVAGRPEKAFEFAEALRGTVGINDLAVNDWAKMSSNPDVYEVDIHVYADPLVGGTVTMKLKAAVRHMADKVGVRVVSFFSPRADREHPGSGASALRDFYSKNPYKVTIWATEATTASQKKARDFTETDDVALWQLKDLGGWSLSPKFAAGRNFILTKDGLFVRGPYGAETFRLIPIRHASMELGLRDAPELVQHAFDYFTGSYLILLDRLIKSGEYHAKKIG